MFILNFTILFVSLSVFGLFFGRASSENLLDLMKKLEKEVSGAKDGVDRVQGEVKNVINRVQEVEKIKTFGYTFIGFGVEETKSGYNRLGDGTTLTQCLQRCYVRHQRVPVLNGVVWIERALIHRRWVVGRCLIIVNDRGHRGGPKFSGYHHYRA